ncbi:MAG: serine/threonine-protein kinase [Isosphaeraceae bacterium]
MLHRDIKPGNVIVGKHGETLVVDWGLAKATGRADPSSAERGLVPTSGGSADTLPGQALGTPAYMSPEQARGDLGALGPRSDVYSLGATLYCLLTARAPFQGKVPGVLEAVGRGDFRPPRAFEPSIDPALEAACLKAMAARPEDRYASARALAEDIERWLADERVEAYREPWLRALTRWLTRHRTAVTAAGAAGLAIMAGLAALAAEQARGRARLEEAYGKVTRANELLAAANEAERKASARARDRLGLAMEAVREYHTGASEDILLRQPELKELQGRLLRGPLKFYEGLRAGLEADGDATG